MYNPVGTAQIGVNFDFIAKALTEQGIEEGSIALNQFFKITDLQYDEDSGLVVLECEVYEQVIN